MSRKHLSEKLNMRTVRDLLELVVSDRAQSQQRSEPTSNILVAQSRAPRGFQPI